MTHSGYKIGIVIPCYNAQTVLPHAFASLKAQTLGFEQLEVLLVDDCSSDGTGALVEQYAAAHANVVALHTEKNSGYAGAPRNLALAHASTPFLMFLDSDDAYTPDACAALLDEAQRSGADLVSGYYREVDEQHQPLNQRAASCPTGWERKVYEFPKDYDIIHEMRQIFWCKIYRTDLVRQQQLSFAEHSTMEDALFLAQYTMAAHSAVYIDTCIYLYTQRTDSLSHAAALRPHYLEQRALDYLHLKEIYFNAGQPICFDKECYHTTDHYLTRILTSAQSGERAQRQALMKAWQPMAALTLQRDLFVPDEHKRAILTALVADDVDGAMDALYAYLLPRHAERMHALEKDAAHWQENYKHMTAERDAVQARLEREPSYRLKCWLRRHNFHR